MRVIRLLLCASASAVALGVLALCVVPAAGGDPRGQLTTPTTPSDSSPQPFSTADQQNSGANDTSASNQYRSTRDGSPSQNGSGVGAATGEPCAGCVGRADNKNPPGQRPNGSDANHGYECDANQGVGQSNPAHTSCATAPAATTTTTSGAGPATTVPGGPGDAGPGAPGASPSGTQGPGGGSTESVTVALRRWIGTTTGPAPRTAAAGAAGGLASTGANLARDTLLGIAAVVLAGLLYLVDSRLLRARRPAPRT